MSRFVQAATLLLLSQTASCHVEIRWPYPLRSKYNPDNSYSNVDYSMTSPLNADGSNFPCKGYHVDRPHRPTVTYTAGSTYNMTLAGSATHGGGSCQIALSYDNGETFKVIKSMIGGCPLTDTYEFTVPSSAPAGEALFAWTWQNYEGNREYYMNCAEVEIASGSGYRRTRQKRYASVDSLPNLWKANLKDITNCTTSEKENPVYPNPGEDVVYGDGMSSSSDPTAGDCDGMPAQRLAAVPSSSSPSDASPSTTTLTIWDCLGDVTVTITPTNIMTESTTTVRPISHPPTLTPAPVSSAGPAHTHTYTYPHPPYVTGNPNNLLPCVPGTFICTSNTTWDTCDYNDGSVSSSWTWIYKSPRWVAAGMMCLPNLSPYSSSTQQYAQQPYVPAGYYRDDRYVRSRPDGDCDQDGSLMCTNGGSSFDICDHGGWVQMGSVAAGTTCRDDRIMSS